MLKQIDDWLKDINRKYSVGLAIFMALATMEIKARYGPYLSSGNDENVSSTDPRLFMLINKVNDIYNKVKTNPEAFKDVAQAVQQTTVATNNFVKEIIEQRETIEALQSQVTELQDSEEDKQSEIDELSNDIEAKEAEIEKLKEQAKQKGIRVMEGKDLPKTYKPKYDRVKVIVPLMAAIHGELKDTTLTDEQRKAKAEELCKLDDERRALWDDIDNYLNDYDSVLTEEKKFEYSEDPVVRGMQIANRIRRLQENIKRNQEAVERHKAANKPDLEKKAREKAEMYQAEYDKLITMVNEEK